MNYEFGVMYDQYNRVIRCYYSDNNRTKHNKLNLTPITTITKKKIPLDEVDYMDKKTTLCSVKN